MTYVVNPADPTSPLNTDDAAQGAEELRALKALIQTYSSGGFTGFNVFRKNKIIGGDFALNPWQRGTTFTLNVGNPAAKTADCWKALINTAPAATAFTVAKVASGLTTAAAGLWSPFCMEITMTGVAPMGVNDIVNLQTILEGYNILGILEKASVFSFWHKHSIVGQYSGILLNSTQTKQFPFKYTQAVADVWERATISVPATPVAANFLQDHQIGLYVVFTLYAGTNVASPTTDAWIDGPPSYYGATGSVAFTETNGAKFRIELVQLEPGTIASPFEVLTYQETLNLCYRYFEKSFAAAVTPASNVDAVAAPAFRASGAAAVLDFVTTTPIPYKARKRTAPTVTTYNPQAAGVEVFNNTRVNTLTTTAVIFGSETGFLIRATGSAGQIAGDILSFHWTADASF